MLRELILSVVSGVIVALILQLFRGRQRDRVPQQAVHNPRYVPTRRRGFLGRVFRLIFAVIGGIAFAQAAAPIFLRRRFGDYDGFDRFDGLSVHLPVLALTVIGTIIVWIVLSAITRR